MELFLVGENIDKRRATYLNETGKVIQLMRGIYIDANSNIETIVLKYAIRISHYLYPRAYLSGASAILLAPTPEGKLYISGPRIQRTRIRNLEIVQNKAPQEPSLASAIIDDGMGEFKMEVSSIRQRFLEAFRRRSEHSASIDHLMRMTMANRVIEEYGSPAKASDALWTLARQNEWFWEGEQAERYLKKEADFTTLTNHAEIRLFVAWHGTEIGTLFHDGFEWHWKRSEQTNLPLIRQTIPGKLPPFVSALLPEGWLENVLKSEDERNALRNGKRYMSNITIVENKDELPTLPTDILDTPLAQYSQDGIFTGTYSGPLRDDIETSFERNLAKIFASSETPRLSGVQIKAPMFLDKSGILLTSENKPFTHILKPAGTSGFEHLPVIEWMSLTLARYAGFQAPDFALLQMPDNMPPALLVERFDIRRNPDDKSMIALEDFCSLLDMTAADKYKGTIEQAARALRAISTSPLDDLLILLKRALFAWLIADGDMHLKNMAVLKIAQAGDSAFQSVRMTRVYDTVTTIVFPGLKNDRQALKLNGKDNRINRGDFQRLAATMGINANTANAAIDELLNNLKKAIGNIALPGSLVLTESASAIVNDMIGIIEDRLNSMDR